MWMIDAFKDKKAWKKTLTDPGVIIVATVLLIIIFTEFIR